MAAAEAVQAALAVVAAGVVVTKVASGTRRAAVAATQPEVVAVATAAGCWLENLVAVAANAEAKAVADVDPSVQNAVLLRAVKPPSVFQADATRAVAATEEVTSANRSDTTMERLEFTALCKAVQREPADSTARLGLPRITVPP